MKTTIPTSLSLAVAGILLVNLSGAWAQTTTWGGSTGSWFVGGNWNNGVPDSGTDALIGTGTSQISTGAAADANQLNIGLGGMAGVLEITSGTLTLGNVATIGNGSGSLGTLTLASGGTLTGSTVTLGALGGSGILNLNGTAGNRGTLATSVVSKGTGSGSINFDGGQFIAQNDGYVFTGFSAGDLQIASGGAFIDTNNHTIGISTQLAGAGGLTVLGGGALILPGANTYQGGTTVASGTIIANDSAAFGTGTITLQGGSSLQVGDINPPVDEVVIANSIVIGAGGGELTNYGSNSKATFSGTISLSGDLTVLAGSDDPAFVNVTGGITGTGNVTLNAVDTASITVDGAINNTGTITNNGSGPRNTVIQSAIGPNVTSVIQDSATSALVLEAASTYAGATLVSNGTLIVNGSIGGATTVSTNGILAGTGTLGSATVDGTLAPAGAVAGQLSFTGGLTLDSGGVTSIDIGGLSAGQFDNVSVGGALGYGGTLDFQFLGGYSPAAGDTFQLFKNFTSQSGTFTAIGFSNPDLAAQFDYPTGTLSFVAIPEPSTWTLASLATILLIAIRSRRAAGR